MTEELMVTASIGEVLAGGDTDRIAWHLLGPTRRDTVDDHEVDLMTCQGAKDVEKLLRTLGPPRLARLGVRMERGR